LLYLPLISLDKPVITHWRFSKLINSYLNKRWVKGGRTNLPYCWKCGTKLRDEDKFCTVCGAAAAKMTREEFTVSSDDLIERVRALLHEGNVTRIIVKDEKGKVMLEIPATIGVIGVVIAPWLAALGVIAALVTNCRIVVERRE
jgi:CBS domain-containing protein